MPDTITLSESAVAILRFRVRGWKMPARDRHREAFHELVAVGIMEPDGNDFRFTLDGKGRTPLALAVKACVDSYCTYRRSAESVEALLRAGASVDGVLYPSGYSEVDALLESHGARGT